MNFLWVKMRFWSYRRKIDASSCLFCVSYICADYCFSGTSIELCIWGWFFILAGNLIINQIEFCRSIWSFSQLNFEITRNQIDLII
uniref:Uncharacterized protein n=1 Tax=Manihot esculenta TaxID=3983 RepID=A0A2C9VRL8_MANES